jgi:ATP-binding cassette subfamily B protein
VALRRATSEFDHYTSFVQDVAAPKTRTSAPLTFHRIRLENIQFSYRGSTTPVLNGASLEINQGEVVALVGENGCGKTTLAKIVCALYRPSGGTVWWDDVDIGQLDPNAVRANVAVVFQNFAQYPTLTAAQNIAIGRPEFADNTEAITTASKNAGADSFLSALPKGYATVLSRSFGGQDLSTGQWQRVALARAFLRDAPLVVLDEPTSALDPRAEHDLFVTVASLYRSRAALLISHRLSSVRVADRICVLADGRIAESGTHDQLLAAGGAYAELFELQARSYR